MNQTHRKARAELRLRASMESPTLVEFLLDLESNRRRDVSAAIWRASTWIFLATLSAATLGSWILYWLDLRP